MRKKEIICTAWKYEKRWPDSCKRFKPRNSFNKRDSRYRSSFDPIARNERQKQYMSLKLFDCV